MPRRSSRRRSPACCAHVDDALGPPRRAGPGGRGRGRGELLTGVLAALPAEVAARLRPYAVERAPRPGGLDERIVWSHGLPAAARAWWACCSPTNGSTTCPSTSSRSAPTASRTRCCRTADGAEQLGEPLPAGRTPTGWPAGGRCGDRGTRRAARGTGAARRVRAPRDEAWAAAVGTLERGLAVAVDYGHSPRGPPALRHPHRLPRRTRGAPRTRRQPRPDRTRRAGRLRGGRSAAARERAEGPDGRAACPCSSQRAALHALDVDGPPPPLALASSDPAAYVRQLAAAGEAAELTDAGGPGRVQLAGPAARRAHLALRLTRSAPARGAAGVPRTSARRC